MGTSSSKAKSKTTTVKNPYGSADASEPFDEDHAGVMGAVPDLGDDEEGSSSEEEEEEQGGDKGPPGPKSFEAKVMMYSVVEGVVKYSIRIKRREGEEIVSSWVIQKRYTEFEKLLKLMKGLDAKWVDAKLPPKYNTAPTMKSIKGPSRGSVSGRFVDKSFLDQRKMDLQKLLDTLIAGSSEDNIASPLRDFLEMARVKSDGYHALITDFVIIEDVVKYNIRVSLGTDDSSWVIQKRFTDFEQLVKGLRATGSPYDAVRLPKKVNRKGPNRDLKFLLKRKIKLQNILDFIISNSPSKTLPQLRDFLESGKVEASGEQEDET